MLDVLELHPVRAPHEHGERVLGVDDVRDLRAHPLGRRRLADEHGQVVEERSLGLARRAVGDELEERAADLDTTRVVGRREAEPEPLAGGRVWVGRGERDVVEVVVDLRLALDERDVQPFADVEVAKPKPRFIGPRKGMLWSSGRMYSGSSRLTSW